MKNTLSQLKIDVTKFIAAGNTDQALSAICQFSHELTRNCQAPGKIFGSALLDSLCQTIGKQIIGEEPAAKTQRSDCLLFIATELYAIGGHSSVIEDLIDSHKQNKAIILFSDTFGTVNKMLVQQRYGHKADLLFKPEGTTHSQTVKWIYNQIQELRPAKTYLFNHMDDAVAVAAAQPELPTDLYFFHHCDHTFTLGLHLTHCRHLDFRQSGFWNCRHQLGITGNRYLPLTSFNQSGAQTAFMKSGALITCTSGSPAKFSQPYEYSLTELIPAILATTKGKHIHIGELDSQTIGKTLARMEELGVQAERWIRVPFVENLSTALRERQIDLYLDSFAICGCKAVIEAIGCGIPVVVHKNYRSRLLSNIDLVYPQAFAWSTPEELLDKLTQYTSESLSQESKLAYEHFATNHHGDVLGKFYAELDQPEKEVQYSLLPYSTDQARAFADELEYLNQHSKAEQKANQRHQNIVELIETVYPLYAPDTTLDKIAFSNMLYRLAAEEADGQTSSSTKMRLAKVRHKIQSLFGLS